MAPIPYKSNADLPKPVRDALDDDAQTTWRKAHDAALETYDGDEQKAAAVAWSAVKRKWKKDGDRWVKKSFMERLTKLDADESTQDREMKLREAWRRQFPRKGEYEDMPWVRDVFEDHVIIEQGDDGWKVPYSIGADDEVSFNIEGAVEVQRQWVEKKEIQFEAPIAKTDDSRQLVFGWANVAIDKSGSRIVDSQGDWIDPVDLEDAAYVFNLAFRAGDEMYTEEAKAELVESMVFTHEKLEKLATDPATNEVDQDALEVMKRTIPQAWWVGFYIDDKDVYEKCRKGEYKMFSIGGVGVREEAAVA